jgi:hypothetical protein
MTQQKKGTGQTTNDAPAVLGPSYEAGKPDAPDNWRKKLRSRAEMVNYLKSAARYWYSDDWYGSERRKTKA